MKNIVYQRPDGGLVVVSIGPPPNINVIRTVRPELSAEEAQKDLESLLASYPVSSAHHAQQLYHRGSIPPTFNIVAMDVDDIPSNEFDDARVWDGGRITFDIVRAKEIRKEQLRREREPIFRKLDGQRAVAIRAGEETKDIDAEAQRLADITKLVDAAGTLDELRAIKCGLAL